VTRLLLERGEHGGIQAIPPTLQQSLMATGCGGWNRSTPTGAAVAAAQPPTPQPLHYWHVSVDSAGMTHQTQCKFKEFSPLSLGTGVELIFVDKLQDTPDHVVIAQFPKGWVGAWHENPAAQWIIPLSGRWFVETMDGHRVEIDRTLARSNNMSTTKSMSCILFYLFDRRGRPRPQTKSDILRESRRAALFRAAGLHGEFAAYMGDKNIQHTVPLHGAVARPVQGDLERLKRSESHTNETVSWSGMLSSSPCQPRDRAV
jgi:hypothetical protein